MASSLSTTACRAWFLRNRGRRNKTGIGKGAPSLSRAVCAIGGILTSGGTLRSVLNPSNRIRIPLLPLGKQLDHDQPRNKSAAEGLAIFGRAAISVLRGIADEGSERGSVVVRTTHLQRTVLLGRDLLRGSRCETGRNDR